MLALAGSIPALGSMFFCTWKDEDGRHFGVSINHPSNYFCWNDWQDCCPKYVKVTSHEIGMLVTIDSVTPLAWTELINDEVSMIEVDINWSYYINEIRNKMRYL